MPKSNDLKDALMNVIKEKREKLSISSAKTYVSLLSTLFKKLGFETIKDLEKEKEILDYVNGIESIQTKKTLLSAVYIITGNENLRKEMIDLAQKSNTIYKENNISDKRKTQYANVTKESIKQIYDAKLASLKKSPSPTNYVQYLITSVCSGIHFPIRRLEWVYVKMKNANPDTDNYVDFKKKQFVFNIYKTVKTHGRQIVQINPELLKVLKAWLKINDNDYLLVKPNGKNFSPSELSKELNNIFGCGIDVLRSVYVNGVYGDALPQMKKLEAVANAMGHSVNSAMTFYRKDTTTNDDK